MKSALVAEREGVTVAAVRRWIKLGVDVADAESVKRWRAEHGRGGLRLVQTPTEQIRNAPTSPAEALPTRFDDAERVQPAPRLGSLTEETTRLAAARADWQALRNAEKLANLISRDRHERLLRESWLPVIERLNDLPVRYGSRFGPDLAVNMALLGEIVRELKSLAKGNR